MTAVIKPNALSACRLTLALISALVGSLQAQLSDVTQPGDPIVAIPSNNVPGTEAVANAIDNGPNKYLSFESNPGLIVTPRIGLTIVSGLTLTSANDHPERDPADYTLEGSYNGSNFIAISSGLVPAFTNRFHKVTILFTNKIPYLTYRLIFPHVVDPASANSMQISEVELLGSLAPRDVTAPGDPIVATSNNSPGSEGVANAIDNQPTKYLNFDRLNTGFTVTPRAGDTIVIGLTLTSANDAPERDPADYTLDGSNDGTNYLRISSGALPPFPTRFYKNYIFFLDNTNSFKSYRLIFPNVVGGTCCMQISEVEFLGTLVNPPSTNLTNLVRRHPLDTPVLPSFTATFRVELTGPWRVQWYSNNVAIPGATTSTYTTPPVDASYDGGRYKAAVSNSQGTQTTDEALLSVFTPSTTESIGLNWLGHGSASGPVGMLPQDITGVHLQAYWNNIPGRSGSLERPLNSSNQPHATIAVHWATSGAWGVGAGEDYAVQRMLDGMATSYGTNSETAQSVTFSNVPPGNHALLLYTVQIPLEFFSMDFQALTFNADGTTAAVQQRFIRPENSDEYRASREFHLVTSDTPATRAVGNTMRFDNLQPGDGRIQLRFFSPDWAQRPPPADPVRGPGLNGLQLLLHTPRVPVQTRISSVSFSQNTASVSFATISGFRYTAEYTDQLNPSATWSPLLPAVTGNGSPATVSDLSPHPRTRFYRVRIE